MLIHRRNLLQRLGGAAAASAILPALAKSPLATAEPSARLARLNRNESPYGPSEMCKVAFQEAFDGANRYPGDDVENLRAAIASAHSVQAENITLGCGSTEILRMAADAYLGPGKNLVAASPTFDFLPHVAALLGAEVRSVPLTRDYGHDLDAMLARTDATSGLLYICNPNNPTGTLTPKSDLEAFLPKIGAATHVVLDEAYHDFVAPSGAYGSFASRAGADPKLIVTRTFSKVYGLAGLRIGYAISSPEAAKHLAERRLPMDVSVVAARAALAALGDFAHVKKIVSLNANARQEFLNQVNARMLRCLDSHSNFVLMRAGDSGKDVAEQLRTKGILVSAGYPAFEKHIRVSLGRPEEMQAFWRGWDDIMPHHPM